MTPGSPPSGEAELYRLLEARVGRLFLQQRLGIETDREARIFGQGPHFFHLENWYSAHSMIRHALQLALIYGRAKRNALDMRLHRHEVPIRRLPAAFDGFTLLHLSDLHFDMNEEFPHALGERVRDLDYDVCVMTGDFRYRTYGTCEPALAGMERVRLNLKGPVYGVLGNHDSIRMVPAMEDMEIRVLINESVTIARGDALIHLVGVDDPHYFCTHNLDRACSGINHDNVSILLAHSPEIYKHAAHSGIDLLLCGHTHGGQICLPGGIPLIYDAKCPRRMAAGAWTYHHMTGYTSVGTGSSIVDARINCLPEITLHRLRSV
ncbi:MAG: metallophosphoesterase [Burkholderiales bacterium]